MAADAEWLGSDILRHMGRPEMAPDPSFSLTPELTEELTAGLPVQDWDILEDAHSLGHARYLIQRYKDQMATEQKLGSMGWTGVGLRVGATILDPVALGATVATEGLASPLIFAEKVGRIGRAVRAGLVAGASASAMEAYQVSQKPGLRNGWDIVYTGAAATAFGGAFGLTLPGRAWPEFDNAAKGLMKEIEATEAAEVGGVVARGIPEPSLDSLSAARVPGTEPVEQLSAAEQRLRSSATAAGSWASKARFDLTSQLKSSQHPIVKKLGNLLAEEAVGNADGSVVGRAATENVSLFTKQNMGRFARTSSVAFKDWAKRNQVRWWERPAKREEFFEEVGRAVRRPSMEYTADPAVNKVADEYRGMMKELLAFAKKKGVPGFSDLAENETYLTRIFNQRRIDELVSDYGEGNINRLLANSLIKRSDDLDYEDALKVATAYLKAVRKRKFQTDLTLSRALSADNSDFLRQVLKEELDGQVTDDWINGLVDSLKPSTAEQGKNARAKRRLDLDETHGEVLFTRDGRQARVTVEDLFVSNAEELMQTYVRQIGGAGFMQDVLRAFEVKKFDPETGAELKGDVPSWETLVRNIEETAGETGISTAQLQDEVRKLNLLYRAVTGAPLNEVTKSSEALRMIRDYNFIRVMNQVGLAQLPEMANILGQGTFRAFFQQMPALRRIWSRAKDGRLEDELLDEIEVIWGVGTDRLRHTVGNRYDDYGTLETPTLTRLDQGLQYAKRVTGDISLMAPINMALQRMAARSLVQRFTNIAFGNGGAIAPVKLATLGLDEAMGNRIGGMIRAHSFTEDGVLGRSIRRINIDAWTDQEAASAFIHAVDRWSRKVIQENDIGMMSEWMTKDLGKTMIQFRSFMVGSWTKQFLYGLHTRDFDVWASWALASFFGGLSYMGQTYVNSIGREDQREFLERRLSAAEVGKAAFQRAGYSSLFPAAVDTLSGLGGFDPVFAYGRTTGLASGIVGGNPTVDLIDSAAGAVKGLVAPALNSDYQYSREDLRKQTAVLPFQNALIIRNMVNAMGGALPERSDGSR